MLKRNHDCLEEATLGHQEFLAILEKEFQNKDMREGEVVTGHVVRLDSDFVIVDVGLKTEGRIPLQEFLQEEPPLHLQVGDEVDVYLECIEGSTNEAILSREKARRERTWIELQKSFDQGERVEGEIFSRVRGGFTVNIRGVVAFLPSSQVDMRPVRGGDIQSMMHIPQMFQILKMDKKRGNIVVSRRAILEEERAEQKSEVIKNLQEGQILNGIVKNITDYGVFVDLGGIDGLLHVTDISWTRINHPRDVLKLGETVRVIVIRINSQTRRISLGMKQLQEDPWATIAERYSASQKVKGRVTNIQDYGAFVELEPGVEGLVHVSEMSWTKKNVVPSKIVSTSQEIEVSIIKIEPKERRISLGLKQCQSNPWQQFAEHHPIGSVIEGRIENITSYCMFISVDGGIDAMLHFSDLEGNMSPEEAVKKYRKGQIIKAKVLDVNPREERISLGIRQLSEQGSYKEKERDKGKSDDKSSEDDSEFPAQSIKKGEVVTCVISAIYDGGIYVDILDKNRKGHIRKSELSNIRNERRPDRFGVGEYVDAMVISDKSDTLQLSIKELEDYQEKKAIRDYGFVNSGASLGEILGFSGFELMPEESKEDRGDARKSKGSRNSSDDKKAKK